MGSWRRRHGTHGQGMGSRALEEYWMGEDQEDVTLRAAGGRGGRRSDRGGGFGDGGRRVGGGMGIWD